MFFGFFGKKVVDVSKFETEIESLKKTINGLKDDKKELQESVENLKLKKKMETEDIKHMVRMKMERAEVLNEKKVLEFEREKDKAIADVKDKYRDKLEKGLTKQLDDMRGMYDSVLKRLPDMSAKFEGKL